MTKIFFCAQHYSGGTKNLGGHCLRMPATGLKCGFKSKFASNRVFQPPKFTLKFV